MKSFLDNYSKIDKNRKEIILGMDHNFDLLKHNTHVPTQKFIELLMENRPMPIITRSTQVTKSSATLLDNIILSMNLYNRYSSSVIMHDISDHFPCLSIISNCKCDEGSSHIPKHKLTEKNISKLKTNLSQIDWDNVLSGKNAEDSMIEFHEKLICELDKVSPECMTHVSTDQVLNISWMTAGILKCSKKQLLLYKMWLKSNKSEDLQKYRCYRDMLKRVKRRRKTAFFVEKCNEFQNNSKKLWSMINNIIGKSSDKRCVINRLLINNIVENNSKIIVNSLANQFANIGKVYADRIQQGSKDIRQYLKVIVPNKCNMYLYPVIRYELKNIIDKLLNKTSSGWDGISKKLVKSLKHQIIKPLAICIN